MVVPVLVKPRSLQPPVETSMGHRYGDDRSDRHTILVCPDTSSLIPRFADRPPPARLVSHV
jgi:hypothetical protein